MSVRAAGGKADDQCAPAATDRLARSLDAIGLGSATAPATQMQKLTARKFHGVFSLVVAMSHAHSARRRYAKQL